MILSVQKHDHHQLFTIKHLSTSHGSSGTHSVPLLMVVKKIDRICPDMLKNVLMKIRSEYSFTYCDAMFTVDCLKLQC
jgi:hypothetical protein